MFRVNSRQIQRSTARVLFGFVLVLLLCPFLVRTCHSIGTFGLNLNQGPSCQEQSTSAPVAFSETLFGIAIPSQLFDGILVASAFLGITFVQGFLRLPKRPAKIVHRRRFLFWIWSRVGPFLQNHLFLPYFAPQRDA